MKSQDPAPILSHATREKPLPRLSNAALRLRHVVLEIILVVMCIVLTCRNSHFATMGNLMSVLRNISIMGIIALGMTVVIIAGEIDLSVGSAAAWSGCLMAWIAQSLHAQHVNMPLALTFGGVCAVAVGTGIGTLTGWLRVRFGVPTFILTLAWFSGLRSAAYIITDNFSIDLPGWFRFLGAGYVLQAGKSFPGVPFPAILFLVTFLVFHFIMNHTPFGRSVYAVGGNAEAARLSGIRVNRVKIIAMATVGAMAAFAGILQASQTMSGSPTASVGMELDVIAAVIIGGTSLMGGAGKVWGTLIGLLFLGVVHNGMTMLNVDENRQGLVLCVVILGAALLNSKPAKRA